MLPFHQLAFHHDWVPDVSCDHVDFGLFAVVVFIGTRVMQNSNTIVGASIISHHSGIIYQLSMTYISPSVCLYHIRIYDDTPSDRLAIVLLHK